MLLMGSPRPARMVASLISSMERGRSDHMDFSTVVLPVFVFPHDVGIREGCSQSVCEGSSEFVALELVYDINRIDAVLSQKRQDLFVKL